MTANLFRNAQSRAVILGAFDRFLKCTPQAQSRTVPTPATPTC